MSDTKANEKSLHSSEAVGDLRFNYLLAFDGSDHARSALDLLLELPKESGFRADVCAVTVISVIPTQAIEGHEQFQQALEQVEIQLNGAGFRSKIILKAGNPAATINSYAEEMQADLILIGARGRRSALGVLVGGVAQQVVEYSNCPVLVVRAPFRGLKQVLLVVDGSPQSDKAVIYLNPPFKEDESQRCAWLPFNSRLSLLHVLPPPLSREIGVRPWALGPEALYPAPLPSIDIEAIEAAELKRGEELLAMTQNLLRQGQIESEALLLRGDAGDQILQTIRDRKIDLVVCGSRGLSAVAGWLLGSVSRKLVHYADCSVLIVK